MNRGAPSETLVSLASFSESAFMAVGKVSPHFPVSSLLIKVKKPDAFPGLPYHRSFAEDVQPPASGQPAELVFDMLPLSRVFAAGHEIRLTIMGADPREKERNESSSAPEVTIWRDSSHSFYVTLPVIPKS
jgi:hypothetical protein